MRRLGGVALLALAACSSASADRAAAPPRIEWPAGEERVYTLALDSESELAVGQVADLHLTGELAVAAQVDGSLTLALRGGKLSTSQGGQAAQADALAAELAVPFEVVLEHGGVTEVHVPRGSSAYAVNLMRTFAGMLQLSPREADATGVYSAELARGTGAGHYTRRKRAYETLALPAQALAHAPMQLQPRVVESSGEVVLSGAQLASARAQEVLELELTTAAPVRSRTSWSIALARTGVPVVQSRGSEHVVLAAGAAYQPPPERAPRADVLDDARIGGVDFDAAVAAAEAQPAGDGVDPAAIPSEARGFATLTALLRRAENVPLALARIRAGSPATPVLLDALASAGTAEAQAALVELTRPPGDDRRRRMATASLVRTLVPTPASVVALTALVDDDAVGLHALYGLGTCARRLREAGEVARADALAGSLADRLAAAHTRAARENTLYALSNAGWAGAIDAVVPFLRDGDALLRQAAVQALRLVDDARADTLLAGVLDADPSDAVRLTVLEAARDRSPSPALEAAIERALGSDDARTRYQAVLAFEAWLPARPELRPRLTRVARADVAPKVREAASAALAGYSLGGDGSAGGVQ